ncbi:hypothetical protein [Streptomyces halstedii]|uniref:hypothetical protein n=1 Tax=Streptomyces halstedii TaxID=1944 RepID=UPI0033A82ECD
MTESTQPDEPPTGIPAQRTEPLPPPPTTVAAGPQDDNLTDEMEEAYWSAP